MNFSLQWYSASTSFQLSYQISPFFGADSPVQTTSSRPLRSYLGLVKEAAGFVEPLVALVLFDVALPPESLELAELPPS